MPKPLNSLLYKKYCESCEKDVSASYFSKHIQSQGHLNKIKTSFHSSSDDDVKDLKIEKILSSENESDKEQSSTYQEEESTHLKSIRHQLFLDQPLPNCTKAQN